MIILPAIDLLGGNAVRLSKGEYDTAKTYSNSPLDVIDTFKAAGAQWAHIVDLDGAKAGKPVNMQIIKDLAQKMPIEIGGGIRDLDSAKVYLDCGASRVILGSAVAKDITLARRGVKLFGDKFAVGVDAKNGKVAVSGWTEVTNIDALDFCKQLQNLGVSTIIYTDIDTDGMLSGTNMSAFRELAKLDINIIASGGISSVDEIKELNALGIYGGIIGKAMYENKLDLREALKAAVC